MLAQLCQLEEYINYEFFLEWIPTFVDNLPTVYEMKA